MRRFLTFVIVLIVLAASAPVAQAQITAAADKNKNGSQLRELQGEVMTKADAPLADAVVYLKNTKTLAVKTFITGQDGRYRFPALAPNVDYDVYAEHKGKRSDTKTLSSFDSRSSAFINLRIDTQ